MKLEKVKNDISEVLFTRPQIEKRIEALGEEITRDYQGKELLIVGILKGGAFSLANLILNIDIHCQVDFMAVSSYNNSTKSQEKVDIMLDLAIDIKGKDVLVVEDIADTGLTLRTIREHLTSRQPKSLEFFCLLRKPTAMIHTIDVRYVGFDVPNQFVVGWGFDYDQMYRNLDVIGILNPEVYQDQGGRAEVYRRSQTVAIESNAS
jgi:hypoxanthine phosphoribosyltransferase